MCNVLIFILLISSNFTLAKIAPSKFKKNSSKTLFKYSKNDQRFALHFLDLNKQFKTGKIKSYTVDSLNSVINKSTSFRFLEAPLLHINKIIKIKKYSGNFKRLCEVKIKSKHALSVLLKKKTAKLCRLKLMKFITKDPKIILQSNLQIYFKDKLAYYLKGENKNTFVNMLKATKEKEKGVFRLISKLIIKTYIKQNIQPEHYISNNIESTPEFQSFMYGLGQTDSDSKSYFTSEFNGIYKSLKKSINNKNYGRAFMFSDQLLSFHSQNKLYINTKRAWRVFISTGNYLAKIGPAKAKSIYEYTLKIATREHQKNESLFQLLWLDTSEKNFSSALKTIENFNLIENFPTLNTKLQFWIGYIVKQSGETHLAKHLLSKVVQNNPLDYYTIISLEELTKLSQTDSKADLINKIKAPPLKLTLNRRHYSKYFINIMRRIALWSDLNEEALAYLEIKELVRARKGEVLKSNEIINELTHEEFKKIVTMNISKLLTSKKQFLQTFKVIHKSLVDKVLSVNNQIVKLLFPFQYYSQIKKIEKEIDPIIILSLIRQESAFNPLAKSIVGARGLMQLMPRTARSISKNVTVKQLTRNPKLNLKIGIKYFKYLLKKYDGNLIYTLSAYNAGETRLRRWIENRFNSDNPLVVIESIPFDETKNYVKYIYRNIFFYNLLNGRENPNKILKNEFTISMAKN